MLKLNYSLLSFFLGVSFVESDSVFSAQLRGLRHVRNNQASNVTKDRGSQRKQKEIDVAMQQLIEERAAGFKREIEDFRQQREAVFAETKRMSQDEAAAAARRLREENAIVLGRMAEDFRQQREAVFVETRRMSQDAVAAAVRRLGEENAVALERIAEDFRQQREAVVDKDEMEGSDSTSSLMQAGSRLNRRLFSESEQ